MLRIHHRRNTYLLLMLAAFALAFVVVSGLDKYANLLYHKAF